MANASVAHYVAGQRIGDTIPMRVTVLTPAGAAKDLTSSTVKWALWTYNGSTEVMNQDTSGVTAQVESPATAGIVTVTISAALTASLSPGTYYDEWAIVDGNGADRTVAHGYIEFLEQKVA